jgi:hypothetical protein
MLFKVSDSVSWLSSSDERWYMLKIASLGAHDAGLAIATLPTFLS